MPKDKAKQLLEQGYKTPKGWYNDDGSKKQLSLEEIKALEEFAKDD